MKLLTKDNKEDYKQNKEEQLEEVKGILFNIKIYIKKNLVNN